MKIDVDFNKKKSLPELVKGNIYRRTSPGSFENHLYLATCPGQVFTLYNLATGAPWATGRGFDADLGWEDVTDKVKLVSA